MAEEEFVPEGDDADETAPDGADTGDDAGKTDGSTEDESDPIEWDPSAIIDASMTVLEADQFSAASAYTEGQTPGPETEDATSTAGQDGANVVTEEDDDSEQDQETWDSLDHYDSDGTGPLTPAQIAAKDTDLGWWRPSSVTVTVQGVQETQGCVRWVPYSDEELFQLYGSDRVAAVEAHFWHDSAGAHVSTTANDATSGPNVLIDTNSLDIRDGTNVNASFGASTVELARRSPGGIIKMCGDKVRVTGSSSAGENCYVSTESWEDVSTGDVDVGFDHPYAGLGINTNWDNGTRSSRACITTRIDDSGARSEVVAESGTGSSLEVWLEGSLSNQSPDGSAGIYDNGNGTTTFAVDADAYSFANPSELRTAAGAAAASHSHAASDITSGTLPVSRGGTGASEIVAAMASLRGVRWTSASSPDLDDLVDSACVYYIYGTPTNCPVSSSANGWVACFSAGTNEVYVQVYAQYGSSVAADRRSVWFRVRNSSATWGSWYEIPSTAKDSTSPSFTASADFTLSSCTGKSRLGAVATIRLSVTTANALTSATSYVIGTIGSGWRPPVSAYGRAADYRDNCWVSTNGQVTYRPGRAVSASSTLTMTFTYVLA